MSPIKNALLDLKIQLSAFCFRMIVMNTINGQLTPVMHQNNAQQMTNDKLKSQQQQVILQQVNSLDFLARR